MEIINVETNLQNKLIAIPPNRFVPTEITKNLIIKKPDVAIELLKVPFILQFNFSEKMFEKLDISGLELLETWQPNVRIDNKKQEVLQNNKPLIEHVDVLITSLNPPDGYRISKAGYVRKERFNKNRSFNTYYALRFTYSPTNYSVNPHAVQSNSNLIDYLTTIQFSFKAHKNVFENGSNHSFSFMGYPRPENDKYSISISNKSFNLYQINNSNFGNR
jgi:hypothetical protein